MQLDQRASSASSPVRDGARAAAILVVAFVPMLLSRYQYRVPLDLAVYRAGGSAVLHGKTLYGAGFGGHTLPYRLPFTYPPFSAVAFVVLAVLPWLMAAIIWFLLSIGSLIYITKVGFERFLVRFDQHTRVLALAVIVGLVLWTVPVTDTLWFGQINLILAALVVFDCMRARRGQGVFVGLATAMKLTPALFIVFLWMTGRRRGAVTAAATTVACWIFAGIVVPGFSREYWFHKVFDVSRPGSPAFFSNQTINGFIARLHGPGWLWIPLGLVLAVVGLWRARQAHSTENEMAAIVLVGLTSLLIAPTSWLAGAVWIVPAIGIILRDAMDRRRVWGAVGVLALFWARVPMLGEKLVRHHVPFIGTTLQSFYAYLLAVLIMVVPTRGDLPIPESELTAGGTREVLTREALLLDDGLRE